jgi:hypothetical protein
MGPPEVGPDQSITILGRNCQPALLLSYAFITNNVEAFSSKLEYLIPLIPASNVELSIDSQCRR